jgi:hypothetical protein
MKRALIIGLSMVLAGCASNRGIKPSATKVEPLVFAQALDEAAQSQSDKERLAKREEKLLEDYRAMLGYCKQELSGFDTTINKQASRALVYSLIGLVAGAVAVPALTAANSVANATWIAGLGGLAGATNVANQSLASLGLSGAGAAKTRNTIVDDLRAQIEIITDGNKKIDERESALMKANAICVVYRVTEPASK